MTFTPRDAKDVSSLVAKKLELYMNYARREERFDPQGYLRTTPKMQTFDLMYQMLDKAELDNKVRKASPRGGHSRRKSSKSPVKRDKTTTKGRHGRSDEKSDSDVDDPRNGVQEDSRHSQRRKEEKKQPIKPKLVENSRRVVPRGEAERLTKTVNQIFEEQDLDKLHVIHRYRPHSHDVAPITENGKVANYTMHVGSALHAKNYVEYYTKEGLQSGKKEYSKRLQRLKTKKEKEEDNEDTSSKHEKESSRQAGSRMREILSPLASSVESIISSSPSQRSSSNLTPITKGKPVYTTFLSSTPHSSRASSSKISRSGQLQDARRFSPGYGYRVVEHDTQPEDENTLGSGTNRSRSITRSSQQGPIRTVIEPPEVPRLGLTSDLNDSNANPSHLSSRLEEYMTAEEKARIHPDTRAVEDKINSSEDRAGERDIESGDMRAEVSLTKYSADEDYVNTEEITESIHVVTETFTGTVTGVVTCAERRGDNYPKSG